MVAIKLQVGEEIRRIIVDDQLPVATQFNAVSTRILELYPELQGRLRLTWRGTCARARVLRIFFFAPLLT